MLLRLRNIDLILTVFAQKQFGSFQVTGGCLKTLCKVAGDSRSTNVAQNRSHTVVQLPDLSHCSLLPEFCVMIQRTAEIEATLYAALDCASPKRLTTDLASLLRI